LVPAEGQAACFKERALEAPRHYFVVARGKDAGAKLYVTDAPGVIGRARDADLVLVDGHVSRHHLRIQAAGGGARVSVEEGASPFLLNGVAQTDALVRVADTVVVGRTALVLTDADPREGERGDEGQSTAIGALMTGLAADVRGIAAAIELVEALDEAEDEEAIRAALAAWGEMYLGASDAKIVAGAAAESLLGVKAGEAPRVVEREGEDSQTSLLAAPGQGGEKAWVVFTRPGSSDRRARAVTDTTRRLVVLAARLGASSLARVRSLGQSRRESEAFRQASLGSARSFLGNSAEAREVARLAARLATSDVVVLLEGETGVGKTFLARLIHESGPRAKAPLRVLNCAAIPETLVESELFGHERGAFTGAATSKPGALESAGAGTVLLDEIGELPLASQAKLLRVLEEKRFERLGSNRPIPLAARVLTATNRDLGAMAEAGTFRADLYYRIAVVKLRIPPLRERGDDLFLLADRILADVAPSAGRRVTGFAPATLELMRRYPWPGNVRELRNAIERALAVGEGGAISPEDFPDTVRGSVPAQPGDASLVRLPARLDLLERRAIEAALRATGGNQRRAALVLGINRVTLHRRLRAAENASETKETGEE